MNEKSPTDRNTPLRLARAVELAFPEGGMTVSGLRREIARGRLEVEVIAGKNFVTLAGIERMREMCRTRREPSAFLLRDRIDAAPKRPDCEVALASALRTVAEIRERYRPKPSQVERISQ